MGGGGSKRDPANAENWVIVARLCVKRDSTAWYGTYRYIEDGGGGGWGRGNVVDK